MISKRLKTFDFFRGFFLFLALLEHYTYIMNNIWVGYYNPFYFGTLSQNISAQLGPIPYDGFTGWLAMIFIPWVTQVYLALATFNMGLKSDKFDGKRLRTYNYKFLLLFIVFTLEKFIIGKNIGEILSPNPLQVWMVVLAILANGYYYLGPKLTYSILFLGGFMKFTPLNNIILAFEEKLMQIHPEFSLDIRPDAFFWAGLIGFVFGANFNKLKTRPLVAVVAFLILGNAIVNFWTPPFQIDFNNAFLNEYAWSYSLTGSLSICLTIATVIVFSMILEKLNKPIVIFPLNMMGIHSLGLFTFHRIYFIFFFIPFRLLLGAWSIFPEINNSFINNSLAIGLYLILYVFMGAIYKKSSR